ncbi:hypothetical protein M501DRAFT_918780, partial [Patellaria atrata CBS 101060]
RPYKVFLTPELHKRWLKGVLSTLALCYLIGLWQGEFHWLWIWFPLGPAGIRTGFLFISILLLHILRIAELRVGPRTTRYPFQTFTQRLTSFAVILTLITYQASAFIFGEVYIWSAPENVRLSLVEHGRSYERPRLNERPLYLRCMFLCLGTVQALLHIYRNSDSVMIPLHKATPLDIKNQATATRTKFQRDKIVRTIKGIFGRSLLQPLIIAFLSPILYIIIFRKRVFHIFLGIIRVWSALPRTAKPGSFPGWIDIMGRFFIEGTLLSIMWEFSNTIFNMFMVREPVKHIKLLEEKPVSGNSKDPNGTLLLGLKAKAEMTKSFAFWELSLITSRFETRRKTIYEELNRPGGTTWTQLLAICLSELSTIKSRIEGDANPKPPEDPQAPPIQTLPKISKPLAIQETIFSKPAPPADFRSSVGHSIGVLAKAYGNSSSPPLKGTAKRLRELGNKHQFTIPSPQIKKDTEARLQKAKESPLGWPFRATFERSITAALLGRNTGASASTIVDAADALSGLAVLSLKEDSFGSVHESIPTIVKGLVGALKTIDSFAEKERGKFGVEHGWGEGLVGEVREALRADLEKVVQAFAEYLTGLGMKAEEVREAKE